MQVSFTSFACLCAIPLLTLKAFVSSLNFDQCQKLIVEAYSHTGGLSLAKAVLSDDGSGENPEPPGNLPWCICRKCRAMPLPEENVCCRSRPCITTADSFETIVTNQDVLSIAIVHRSDVYSDDPEYGPSDYRKAAYRQWTLWRYGDLGRRNRKVIPSCIVWAVRTKYPAPDSNI